MFLSDIGYFVTLSLLALFLTTRRLTRAVSGDAVGRGRCGAVVLRRHRRALVVLFAAGLRLRDAARRGRRAGLARAAVVAAAVAMTILANIALYRHDAQFDLTRERAFTPSPEAQRIVQRLWRSRCSSTFFYQKQDPAGRDAAAMLRLLARLSPLLEVDAVDSDQQPALANRMGVQVYNTAVVRAGDRRIEVVTTDEQEVALAVLRAVRGRDKIVCFADRARRIRHRQLRLPHAFRGGRRATATTPRAWRWCRCSSMGSAGCGRCWRSSASSRARCRSPPAAECRRIAPRWSRPTRAPATPRPMPRCLRGYLGRGGGVLMLIEPDYPVDESLAAGAGRRRGQGRRRGRGRSGRALFHRRADDRGDPLCRPPRSPAAWRCRSIPARGRSRRWRQAAPRLPCSVATSAQAYRVSDRLGAKDEEAAALARRDPAGGGGRGPVGGVGRRRAAFRLVVVGDADFASNSFFPYLANADLLLGAIAWLIREERAPVVKPPVEVLPTVALTGAQMRGIFITTVLLLPGAVALIGGLVWWRRRA